MKKVILFIICLTVALSSQGAAKIDADSAYVRGDFAQAVELYEQLLTEGESAEVYYNLGNSYFKLDNMGKSILNYERALLLDLAISRFARISAFPGSKSKALS